MSATTAQPKADPLGFLESSSAPVVAAFVSTMAGQIEEAGLSPDYFYNWSNWSNGNP
ncbi:hypothetical protein GCM10022221_68130 [Actinocorallia aurea]